MIDGEVLLWTGIGFLVLAVGAGTVWLVHAAWASASERRRCGRRPAVLAELAAALQGADPARATALLARLGSEERIGLLVEMAFTVAGDQRSRLNEIALANGVMSTAERWARSRRWGRRLRAARLLGMFGRGDEPAGELLLRDPHAEVRAEAAEWAADHPTRKRIERLAEMLDDPSPRSRFFAREALIRAGGAAVDPLRERLDAGEWGRAGDAGALEVATALATPQFAVAALRAMQSPSAGVRAQGATLTGAVGGPEAARALELLLADPAPTVREAAARGLGRLGHWQSAAKVSTLLADPAWGTRRAAAAALNRMGPTGELFLRRTARTECRAGDTAKHALALAPADEADAEAEPSEVAA